MTTGAHGVRRTYQQGCRCAACTDANRQYSARYRSARRAGRPVLGAHVAGTEAARVVALLVAEGYLKREIAIWLGHQWPLLQFRVGAGVTVRTVLRLRVIYRRRCEESLRRQWQESLNRAPRGPRSSWPKDVR